MACCMVYDARLAQLFYVKYWYSDWFVPVAAILAVVIGMITVTLISLGNAGADPAMVLH